MCAACGTGVCVCSIDHHFGVNIYHWAARARNKRGIKPVIKWQRHDGCMISKISVWPNVTLKCKQYDILGKASMFLSVNCWKKGFPSKMGKSHLLDFTVSSGRDQSERSRIRREEEE